MKSITLSIVSFFIYLVILIVINKIRSLRSERKAFTPIFLSIGIIPVYLLLYFTTSDSLGIFSPQFLNKNLLTDVVNGLLFYICFCVGFVDFLIGAAITPFSTDILLEIYQSGGQGLSESDLRARYCINSSGKGLVSRRILFLNKIGLIRELPDEYLVPKTAIIWVRIIQGLRRLSS